MGKTMFLPLSECTIFAIFVIESSLTQIIKLIENNWLCKQALFENCLKILKMT